MTTLRLLSLEARRHAVERGRRPAGVGGAVLAHARCVVPFSEPPGGHHDVGDGRRVAPESATGHQQTTYEQARERARGSPDGPGADWYVHQPEGDGHRR